jgi:hypothetical protein
MSKRTAGIVLFALLAFLAYTQFFMPGGAPAPAEDHARPEISGS